MLAPVHLRPTIEIRCKDDLSVQIKMDGGRLARVCGIPQC